ncbi:acyltransferase family protein [Arthrobacter sedimenti]|uniref:Acyltransferase family protein n=1 Tax=Arthrobacter sedimenti TaxID=2694931 RepID=A0ABV8WGR6_9MICC
MSHTWLDVRPAEKPVKKPSAFRPDVQGLRAVAVLAVITDHLLGYPVGGFVGVDIFFVISGFLITGLLLREQETKGRISFANFYRRRVRRIMPVAVIVLAATVGASWAVYSVGRSQSITIDGLWALVFGANWHLAWIGTDYMDATASPSPLQHFWSLAVEEQFYIVWPWLILAVAALGSRLGWMTAMTRRVLGSSMVAVVAASFVFAMWETASAPTVAYFSTFSRAWELGIGAVFALWAPLLMKMPAWLRPLIAYAGLAGIAWSVFYIAPESAFPAPWAGLPVLATALVIGAGTGGQQKYLGPLTNPVAQYIGNISYSLYLWHFPVIVLARVFFAKVDWVYLATATVMMAVLSIASYHFVEDPIRKSTWLEPGRQGNKTKSKTAFPVKAQIAGLCVLALAAAGTSVLALSKNRSGEAELQTLAYANPSSPASASAKEALSATDALAAHIGTATRAPEWPDLHPSVDELGRTTLAPEWSQDGCLGLEQKALPDPQANAQRCIYGAPDAPKTAVILGDSVAISYAPGIRAALEPKGYKILIYTMQQCPAANVAVLKLDKSPHPQCAAFRQWSWGKIAELKPDLLFLTSSQSPTLASGADGPAFLSEWGTGYGETFKALSGAAKRTVVLDPPPGGVSLKDCATRISKPKDCKTNVTNNYKNLQSVGRNKLREFGNDTMQFIDTKNWFCTQSDECPSFVGQTPVYADGLHLTSAYSASLGPVIVTALKLE